MNIQRIGDSDLTVELKEIECCKSRGCEVKLVWLLNLVAAFMHLINAAIMVVLFYSPDQNGEVEKDVCYQLTRNYASWEGMPGTNGTEIVIKTETENTSILSLHWLIVGFHLLSFVFQFAPVLLDPDSAIRLCCCTCDERNCARIDDKSPFHYGYTKLVTSGRNPLRFVEYSISASIMLMCIGLLTGIRDENVLLGIAVLCAACQVFGYVAESVHEGPVRYTSHVAGWATLMTSYGIIWSYYIVAHINAAEGFDAPEYVHGIVITMFVLFNTFGVVQMTQLYCKSNRCLCCAGNSCSRCFYRYVGEQSELSYIFLSIFAKTVLGWVIYAQVLFMATKC